MITHSNSIGKREELEVGDHGLDVPLYRITHHACTTGEVIVCCLMLVGSKWSPCKQYDLWIVYFTK